MTQASSYYEKVKLHLSLTKIMQLTHLAHERDERWTIQPPPANITTINYDAMSPTVILFKFCGFCSVSGFPHFRAIQVSTCVLNHRDMTPQGSSSNALKSRRAEGTILGSWGVSLSCSLYRGGDGQDVVQ